MDRDAQPIRWQPVDPAFFLSTSLGEDVIEDAAQFGVSLDEAFFDAGDVGEDPWASFVLASFEPEQRPGLRDPRR